MREVLRSACDLSMHLCCAVVMHSMTKPPASLRHSWQLNSTQGVWHFLLLACAVLAFSSQVIAKEGLTTTKEGLEAIIFTADGDMRQALNNLQVRPAQRKPCDKHPLDAQKGMP
jgi:hypothetical protein